MFIKTLLLFSCLVLLIPGKTHAYEVQVHGNISDQAYDLSILSQTNRLASLGITNAHLINGLTAKTWINNGSRFEDDGRRALNHFYDPTTGNGLLNLPDFIATNSINWGLKLQPCGISNPGCGTLTQAWSIPDARFYLYEGLTNQDPVIRKDNLAWTFRALGHIIHLIQDMAQPQHVRNDIHFHGFNLPVLNFDRSRYEEHTLARAGTLVYGGYALVSFSNYYSYWDASDSLDGRGLAEVTNRNFFSERYTFSCTGNVCSENGYAQPTIDLSSGVETVETVTTRNGIQIGGQLTFYSHTFTDPITGESVTNPRVLTRSLFDIDLQARGIEPFFSQNRFTFEETSKILIKRAVGYSAGLLNYFFRGQLKAIPISGGIQIQNSNTETMNYYIDPDTGNPIGSIHIYYDNTFSDRQLLASYNLPGALAPGELTPVISFTHPTDNIQPGRYIIVFRGKLGEEEGAVIGHIGSLKIYYVSTRGGVDKIYRMETDGSNPTLVHDNQDPNITLGYLAPSPDGSRLAFVASSSSSPALNPTIYIRDLVTGTVAPFTEGESPSWSPDGTKIVFHRETGQSLPFANHEIFTKEIVSGVETQLTTNPDSLNGGFNNGPAWSPDGAKIALYKFRVTADPLTENCGNHQIIYLINALGNWLEPLSCTTVSLGQTVDKFPSWSGRGNEIVFQRRFPGKNFFETYKVNVATKVQTKLTESNGMDFNEFNPVFSPDGQVIAVASERDGDFDIWLVDPNGGGYLTNLTNSSNAGVDGWPVFGFAP